MKKKSAVLLLSCPERKGVVASIAGFVFQHGGNILHADEHSDVDSGTFLMRVEFDPKDFDIDLTDKDLADFGKHFSPVAEKFKMKWRLAQSSHRQRMNNSYGFDIEGAGQWTVKVEDGSVSVVDGLEDGADVTISASQEVFEQIVAGEQNPTSAYMTGKLKLKGDMGAAMKLQKLF